MKEKNFIRTIKTYIKIKQKYKTKKKQNEGKISTKIPTIFLSQNKLSKND